MARDRVWVQVWVVDCADTRRLGDCKAEFEKLLQQERLAGSSLLVFANKQVRAHAAGVGVFVSAAADAIGHRICPGR